MDETSLSLLQRIKDHGDNDSWDRLFREYRPLVLRWLQKQGLRGQDADDVVQDVMTVVARKSGDFDRQRTGSFRKWLRSITVNCLRDHWRSRKNKPIGSGDDDVAQLIQQLEDPASGMSQLWEREHQQFLTQALLKTLEPSFAANTWAAFQRVAIQGESADAVAEDLGMTPNAVFIAKSRVLAKLRQEGQGLID